MLPSALSMRFGPGPVDGTQRRPALGLAGASQRISDQGDLPVSEVFTAIRCALDENKPVAGVVAQDCLDAVRSVGRILDELNASV